MNTIIVRSNRSYLRREFTKGEVTLIPQDRLQPGTQLQNRVELSSEQIDESSLPSMRLAALISLSAMASTLLLALYLLQR